MSKTFSRTIDKNFDVSASDYFGFVAVSGVSQRWEFRNTTKKFCKKNRVEKFLQKIRPKIQNRFFVEFVYIKFLGVSR
jgi:hypothetical protein